MPEMVSMSPEEFALVIKINEGQPLDKVALEAVVNLVTKTVAPESEDTFGFNTNFREKARELKRNLDQLPLANATLQIPEGANNFTRAEIDTAEHAARNNELELKKLKNLLSAAMDAANEQLQEQILQAEAAAKAVVPPAVPLADPSSPPAAATTPDPATAPKPTVVAIPQANATATYTFDPEKHITKNGIRFQGAECKIESVGKKAVPENRQAEIKDMIYKIERKNYRNFIESKPTDYKIAKVGGKETIVNASDGKPVSDDQMKQIRADYMKDGRTDENLNKTAKEVLATEGKNFTLNFKTEPPTPAAAPEVYDVVTPTAAPATRAK